MGRRRGGSMAGGHRVTGRGRRMTRRCGSSTRDACSRTLARLLLCLSRLGLFKTPTDKQDIVHSMISLRSFSRVRLDGLDAFGHALVQGVVILTMLECAANLRVFDHFCIGQVSLRNLLFFAFALGRARRGSRCAGRCRFGRRSGRRRLGRGCCVASRHRVVGGGRRVTRRGGVP